MRLRAVQRAFVVAGVGLLGLVGSLTPAGAATSPAWRVVKTFGPAEGVWSDNLTALSASDSWCRESKAHASRISRRITSG
jgi:hypothetical protein